MDFSTVYAGTTRTLDLDKRERDRAESLTHRRADTGLLTVVLELLSQFRASIAERYLTQQETV